MTYILEVQRFDKTGYFNHIRWNGKYEHIGYMNKLFPTKKDAADYYNMHNKHMRKLNAHGCWNSAWDPKTRLRYVVREYYGEYLMLPSFEEDTQLYQPTNNHADMAFTTDHILVMGLMSLGFWFICLGTGVAYLSFFENMSPRLL
jgi:hypothetical protein